MINDLAIERTGQPAIFDDDVLGDDLLTIDVTVIQELLA